MGAWQFSWNRRPMLLSRAPRIKVLDSNPASVSQAHYPIALGEMAKDLSGVDKTQH